MLAGDPRETDAKSAQAASELEYPGQAYDFVHSLSSYAIGGSGISQLE